MKKNLQVQVLCIGQFFFIAYQNEFSLYSYFLIFYVRATVRKIPVPMKKTAVSMKPRRELQRENNPL